jgi:peptidoglycan/xylan/chitin deacetylase (PgdA/CDA1 family)
MRRIGALVCILAGVAAGSARAAECPGNPDAIGTSRTINVDAAEHPRVGTMQYQETLPLNDHEIVLTFDDGPLPPKTTRVLEILASQCVKATFFIIGKMATEYPETLKRTYAEGHSIGTHTETHPLNLKRAPLTEVQAEVEGGIASVTAALGDPKEVAPFFRIPGLERQEEIDDYLQSRGLMTWSADFVADDWKHISASEVYRRALQRIEAKHKGVLLLHDIQPATVAALPRLLQELKRRGYHIVHVAPTTPEQPKTITEPSEWLMSSHKPSSTPGTEPSAEPAPLSLRPTSHDTAVARPQPEQADANTHVVVHIPLPPTRPRTVHERSAITGTPLPPPNNLSNPPTVGHMGVPQPGTPEEPSDVTTGSMTVSPAEKDAGWPGEPILRPSAEIPPPKPQ